MKKRVAAGGPARPRAGDGIDADDRRTGERRQEHRQRHHPEHGLRPEELQPAQANQQVQRQAPRAGLEREPHERHGRAGGADHLQRRDVRDQRQVDVCHRRRNRPADLAHAGASSSRACSARAITRGAATIYNGKLFRVTIDNHVLALDMKTGKQIWNQKFADAKEGYYATSAPIVANGVLISGMAGGESTTRGFLDGWDPDTGKKLWRRYTIPAPGEPGSETWPKDSDAWKYGGGPTWRSGSYDPAARSRLLGRRATRSRTIRRPREALDSLYHVQRARDPAEDRRDRLPLPVHAQRRLRRGRHRRAGARRHPGRRPASQGDDPGQQERLPVRAGPHQLQADRGAPATSRSTGPRTSISPPAGRC